MFFPSLRKRGEKEKKRPDQGRFVSSPPTNTEELRTEYKIMTNLWLLAQMREPRSGLYADLDKDTFMDFADEFISEKNFLREKRINEFKMVIPQWEH